MMTLQITLMTREFLSLQGTASHEVSEQRLTLADTTSSGRILLHTTLSPLRHRRTALVLTTEIMQFGLFSLSTKRSRVDECPSLTDYLYKVYIANGRLNPLLLMNPN
jgi:hypothetical protein